MLNVVQADGSPGQCAGKGAVLRVGFGNFLFFAGHFILLLGCRKKMDPRQFLHTGCLTLQTLLWAGIIGSTFVMPNHVFYIWGQVSFYRLLRGYKTVYQDIQLIWGHPSQLNINMKGNLISCLSNSARRLQGCWAGSIWWCRLSSFLTLSFLSTTT